MVKNLKWKVLLIIIVVALALWKAYPPLDIRDKDGNVVEKGKINLGLDLQGGMHLVLRVDTSKIPPGDRRDMLDIAKEIIRKRIDPQGVGEILIQKRGKDHLIIELPGETDRERALNKINQAGHLEFRLVSDDPDLLKKAFAGEEIEGYELLKLETKEGKAEELLVDKTAALTGDTLVNAVTDFSQQSFGQPYVSITFNNKGAALFAAVTQKNVGKRLAIVLDGAVQSAPLIREPIPSGRAQITGSYSVEEANDLSDVLRSGSLPVPVAVEEERTVGPSLGKDSIEKGIKAIIVGGIAVLCFMAFYYLMAGLIADFALLLNMILITGTLAYFHATLTLPGIAGLVLTIGMAVDANVLIFERIREESNLGKSIRASIQAGFQKAFLTILDSNITTLITALILFQFGTGPVRGFATTLSIGIVSSMFCALVVMRLILDLLTTGGKKIDRLKMFQFIKKPNINFIGLRKIAYILSVIAIIGGMFLFMKRGEENLGIDFTGGTLQQFRFEKPVAADDVRTALSELGLAASTLQRFGEGKGVIIRTPGNPSQDVIDKFKETFADNSFEVMRVESVGPAVGKDLTRKAINATLLAMVGILIYVGFRFEFRFAVAAVLALFHDVFVSLGAIAFTGREISLPVVAALLTIVGYSINDTIVLFDRIREDRKLMRKATYGEIINTSINQTLSRTILTSLTTLLVVLSLYFLGGEVINDFAFVLMCGIVFGTYSSIFIAAPLLLDWPGRKHR